MLFLKFIIKFMKDIFIIDIIKRYLLQDIFDNVGWIGSEKEEKCQTR